MKRKPAMVGCLAVLGGLAWAASAEAGDEIPAVYANLHRNAAGKLVVAGGKREFALKDETPLYTLRQLRGNPVGTAAGFRFEFRDPDHPRTYQTAAGGRLYYALMDPRERLPLPKFKRGTTIDDNGVANARMLERLEGRYDFIEWKKHGRGHIYYRVVNAIGEILYDGRFSFTGSGPFHVDPMSIVDGPSVNMLTHESAVIAFESLRPAPAQVAVKGVGLFRGPPGTRHEIRVEGLSPDTTYEYVVWAGAGSNAGPEEGAAFRTAPRPGSRRPFTFAFASDSRSGINVGERNLAGTNAYMMKKVLALALERGAAFLQFTGDEIDGYRNDPETQRVEYANWRRAILPWAAHIPVVAGMGNHEALVRVFDDGTRRGLSCARFPFETQSAETIFAESFVNPLNGPESEDGAAYDPDPARRDFPSYKENVFHYTYANVAVVVLNSDYWYSPSVQIGKFLVGGNPHGYLMDKQIAWLRRTLERFEADEKIDHVFVTHHTPAWPNGGHIRDDMFYGGKNVIRPWIAGKPHPKGIIERRDEYWRILMDAPKVVAVLTGDEHNYARLAVASGMPVYAEGRFKPDNPLEITRTVWQVNNGAAGAPYYGLEQTPWNADFDRATGKGKYLRNFTTENALVLFRVDGKQIRVEVWNPDSLDRIE